MMFRDLAKSWLIRQSFLLLLCTLAACTSEFLTQDSPADAIPDKGLLSMRYEVENLTYQQLDNPGHANAFDKIHAMAKAVRSKINVEIYEDGTSDWRMEKMTPAHDVHIKDLTPPNRTPQTHITRVSRSGKARFYGSDGGLLKEETLPIRLFSQVANRTRQDPSVAYSLIGVRTKEQVNKLLAEGQRNGAVIQQLGNGNVSIRSTVTKNVSGGARQATAQYVEVNIINPDLGILVGSNLYDDKNQLVNEVFYRYKLGADKQLLPEAIHQKSWTNAPKSGDTFATVSNTYFDNVSVTLNQ